MPDTYIKNANTWSKFKKAFIKNGGTWSEIKTIWIKNSGVWQKVFVNETIVNVSSQNNINLKTLYTNQTGAAPSSAVRVIYNINGNIGSTSNATPSLVTDTWPAGSEIFINIGSGISVLGAGGNSGFEIGTAGTQSGGDAISLSFNVTISNLGTIGGGGGAGGSSISPGGGGCTVGQILSLGGGGAGSVAGSKSLHGRVPCGSVSVAAATNGTSTTGGNGSSHTTIIGPYSFTEHGGKGGDLGQAGGQAFGTSNIVATSYYGNGGAAGKAIALNTYTATRPVIGTVLGSVS